MPKITIITPTYNSSKFISRTIDSVINQTFSDWEFLIIDDHSTDNTVELINEYVKKDLRIKLLKTSKNSGGPAGPKNVGIKNALGEYVAFLDHDDEWLPEKLDKQLQLFESTTNKKLGLVSCFLNIKDSETGKIISNRSNLYRKDYISHLLEYNFLSTSSCVVTKLSILKEVGLFDTNFKVSDDWDMWLRILKSGYEFDFVPEYLVDYFRHGKNLSSNIETEIKDLKILVNKNITDYLTIKESVILSYYYFNKGQYKLSRKYYIHNLLSQKISPLIRIKSFVYIIFTFFPWMKNIAQKIFNYINNKISLLR